MNWSELDQAWMRDALALAAQAGRETLPNPRVGCVLVKEGQVIGRGFTQALGQAHAEVMALRDAQARGFDARGATAYVTLEPCSHFGRTPPCANALIEAGIARVVAALEDPNPQVAGQGLARLQAAGIQVAHGLMAQEASELNCGFLKRMRTGLPWVRLKIAASLDGVTALANGQSQWITDFAAREDGHRWRARADLILTGIGTVLADDPQLNARVSTSNGPQVIGIPKMVLDSDLRLPLNAKVVSGAPLCVVHSRRHPEKEAALQALGVSLLYLPSADGMDGGIDLPALLQYLGQQQMNEVHIEAGARLSGALIAADRVDELLIYLGGKLLGSGMPLFHLPPLTHVNQARELSIFEAQPLGKDVRIRARVNFCSR